MTWIREFDFTDFSEDFADLRSTPEEAQPLLDKLLSELSPGHPLFGLDFRVVARAWPQDEVVVETATGDVALVHMTWSGRPESSSWPTTEFIASADEFRQTIEFRY